MAKRERITWRGLAPQGPPANAQGAIGHGGTPSDPDSIELPAPEAKRALLDPWECHARPAALNGKTCGHQNTMGGVLYAGLVCCAGCGATKAASDARSEKKRSLSL